MICQIHQTFLPPNILPAKLSHYMVLSTEVLLVYYSLPFIRTIDFTISAYHNLFAMWLLFTVDEEY